MEKNAIIDKLFSVGAHFGYAPSRRHPSAKPFIFGAKGGSELFDLTLTAQCLETALTFVKTLAEGRKTLLFVGGKAEARGALERAAQRLNQPYVASRWIGGTLTNFSEIRRRLNRLQDITSMNETGEIAKFTKHERLLIEREAEGLEVMFGGLKGMTKLPEALFVVDPRHEDGAVAEAKKLKIPVIALMNSDCDKAGIQYPIPANDASLASIQFILDEAAKMFESNLGPEKAPDAPAAEVAAQSGTSVPLPAK
ncbi:30S ribosomal protein S2 [Acetobacteraceae bacterium]|nr:30S ribosomal protein S2 [Candidatus Parcubacteria bacterium]